MAWFKKSAIGLPERPLDPAKLTLPFGLPAIELHDDGSIQAHREAAHLVMVSETLLREGRTPGATIVGRDLRTWRAQRIVAICDSGEQLFGRRIFFAEMEYAEGARTSLEALRATLLEAIENDPDDVWDQGTPRDVLVARAARASTFDELVGTIIEGPFSAP